MPPPRRLYPRYRSVLAIYGLWRPEPHVPPAFWRSMSGARHAVHAGLAALLLLLVLRNVTSFHVMFLVQFGGALTPGTLTIALGCLLFCWFPYYRYAKRRYMSYVRQAGFRVCWDCGYQLQGLPDFHACPECGRECNEQIDSSAWKLWIKIEDQSDHW